MQGASLPKHRLLQATRFEGASGSGRGNGAEVAREDREF